VRIGFRQQRPGRRFPGDRPAAPGRRHARLFNLGTVITLSLAAVVSYAVLF
jgi:hypothetical protein